MEQFLTLVQLGFHHVLDWLAYDHILFLIVLTVIYSFKQWRKTLLLVSFFTIGHTTSLLITAYNLVNVNVKLVEFLVPITILITAIFNIILAKKPSNTSNRNLFFAMFFGIIHGLAFSSYFKMLPIDENFKFFGVLEFSVGIEISQILITVIILSLQTIFLHFNNSKKDWILIASSIAIGLAIPMLIENKIW